VSVVDDVRMLLVFYFLCWMMVKLVVRSRLGVLVSWLMSLGVFL